MSETPGPSNPSTPRSRLTQRFQGSTALFINEVRGRAAVCCARGAAFYRQLERGDRRALRIALLSFWGGSVALVVLFALFWDEQKAKSLKYWLQVLTGNWSPDAPDRYQFAMTAWVALLINWGPLLVAFGYVISYVQPYLKAAERNAMTTHEYLLASMEMLRTRLLSRLREDPNARATVEQVIDDFINQEEQRAASLLGEARAKQLREESRRRTL